MLSSVALSVSLASILFFGESIRFKSLSQFPFVQDGVHRKILEEGNGQIRQMESAPPHVGEPIPQDERDTWNVDCTSVLANHECVKTIDGYNNTFWQTKVNTESIDSLPHTITIDLRENTTVNAISMRPLPDADLGGAIAGHKVYLSVNNKEWDLVAFGTWFEDVQGELLLTHEWCQQMD